MKAETYIQHLQKAVEDICAKYINDPVIQSLEYATKPYGTMQYEELKQISQAIHLINDHINMLLDDCRDIPDGAGE